MVLLQVESNRKPIQHSFKCDIVNNKQKNIINDNDRNSDKLPWTNIPSYSGIIAHPKDSNNNNDVEMISNPSKKNSMSSYISSKNSKQDTFAYNYHQNINNNGKLIDIENDNIDYDIQSQALSIASTNSEALFQQQLYMHIKGENNFKTIV